VTGNQSRHVVGPSPRRDRRQDRREAGFTLVGLIVVGTVLTIGACGLVAVIVNARSLSATNRETSQAANAAKQVLEHLRGTPPDEVFATFNSDPSDDVEGEGTAPGHSIVMRGAGDPDGTGVMVAEIQFPVDENTPLERRHGTPDLRAQYRADEPMKTSNSGFTLLEIMIVTVALAVVMMGVYAILGTGIDTYGAGMRMSELERHANRVAGRIAEELADSSPDMMFPTPGPPAFAKVVNFRTNSGYTDGAIVWGPHMRIEFQYAPDDPDDGVDNNGNGLVDEGRVVRRENPGEANERLIVLTNWVPEYLEGEIPNGTDDNGNGLDDERGFSLTVERDVWTVHLSLSRADPSGRMHTHTVEVSVQPRNE
jgi:prepilin-type N-terminal cleavage/methylation domain-containing protein